jgi:hypothetical protein
MQHTWLSLSRTEKNFGLFFNFLRHTIYMESVEKLVTLSEAKSLP